MTKIQAIADDAAAKLTALIKEAADEIERTWSDVAEEAQAQESSPKLKLSFGITLDLDKNRAEYALTFGVRRKLSCCAEISDPDQINLPWTAEEVVE